LWELLPEAFHNSGGGNPSLQMIDSSMIRAHHCSAGAKANSASGSWPLKRWPFDELKRAFTTEIDHRINAMGLRMAFALTGGEVSDYKGYLPMMNATDQRPRRCLLISIMMTKSVYIFGAICPELNPVENIWQVMRDNWRSNRLFTSPENIVDH
jgi:hypothetical protein